MIWSEYKEDVKDNATEYIKDNFDSYSDFDSIYSDMFIDDGITGNGSGSYTFNSIKAEENVKDIIFDEDVVNTFKDFGYDGIPTEKGPEACDVITRCLALDAVYGQLEDLFNELKEEKEETEAIIEELREYQEGMTGWDFCYKDFKDNNEQVVYENLPCGYVTGDNFTIELYVHVYKDWADIIDAEYFVKDINKNELNEFDSFDDAVYFVENILIDFEE